MNLVIFGKRSNLSIALAEEINSANVFSTKVILDEYKLARVLGHEDIFEKFLMDELFNE